MPSALDGVRIQLPDTALSVGLRVTVRSRRLSGRSVFSMLYDEEAQETALEMGIVALKALERADVSWAPFSLFTEAYDYVRALEVVLTDTVDPLLSTEQKRSLRRLLRDYVTRADRDTLVHGDLQATHLIFDSSARSLGFIDLEAMRIGKAVTNFAQLWEAYYYADPHLGKQFYQRYADERSDGLDGRFDADARAELALRCHSHIRVGRSSGQEQMVGKASDLMTRVLSGEHFEDICRMNTR